MCAGDWCDVWTPRVVMASGTVFSSKKTRPDMSPAPPPLLHLGWPCDWPMVRERGCVPLLSLLLASTCARSPNESKESKLEGYDRYLTKWYWNPTACSVRVLTTLYDNVTPDAVHYVHVLMSAIDRQHY